MLDSSLKNKERQPWDGWGKGNTFQGKTAACSKAQQLKRLLNLETRSTAHLGGRVKNVGRSEMFLIRKLYML